MKKILKFMFVLASLQLAIAQESPNNGFLPSRVSTATRNAFTNPAKGLIIFNTDTNSLQINDGTGVTPNWISIGGMPSGGTAGQVLAKIDGTNYNTQWVTQVSGGSTPAMNGLTCSAAFAPTTANQGSIYSGTSSATYSSSNGNAYPEISFASSGVLGLTLTIPAGTLVASGGTLNFTIYGTATSSGTATFTINFAGTTCTKTMTVTAPAISPLPANVVLGNRAPYYIASVYDNDYLPYTAPVTVASLTPINAGGGADPVINLQGTLTTTGITIPIAYTVTNGAVTVQAYSQILNVPASYTEDGISRDVQFSYPQTIINPGTGYLNATLKAIGGTLNAKKLDLNSGLGSNKLGWLLAQFSYAKNNSGGTENFDLRVMPGIPDRAISVDAQHAFLYLPVTSPTGRVWLNNNLGAYYSDTTKGVFNPAKQATSDTDYNAYGSKYQWGRLSDGHELMTYTSASSGNRVNIGTHATASANDVPGHNLLITASDWRSGGNNALWQGVNGINNPCPLGYRVPTQAEYNAELPYDTTHLKFTKPGYISYSDGIIYGTGSYSWHLTSTVSGSNVFIYYNNTWYEFPRGYGGDCRCIQD